MSKVLNKTQLFSVVFLLIGSVKPYTFEYSIVINEARSAEIPEREDLVGRLEYEKLLVADPLTGEIPMGIKQAEMNFTKIAQIKARSQQTDLNYESAGPFNVGGRTRAVAFDTRDENIILAGGVSGGMWKSINGGRTWVRKSNPENRNSITCLVQDTRPGKEDTWYHGTGELVGNSTKGGGAFFRGNGIYKSPDNGESWNPIASTQDSDPNVFNSQFQYIWDIVTNPNNLTEDEILIAAYGGILRSLDGGDTWEVELGRKLFNLPNSINFNDATLSASRYTSISRGFNDFFYATLSTATGKKSISPDAGIFVSDDGDRWARITPFEPDSEYRRIVAGHSKSNPEISYFLVDSNPPLILRNILSKSGTTGVSYNFSLGETPNFEGEVGFFNTQGSYNMMIKVHPEDPNIVFTGGTNLYRSTDGFSTGENSKWIGGYGPGEEISIYPNHHPDQHDLLFYPNAPNKMLSASDGGLRVSDNGTADSVMWRSLNNGFITSQFYTIAQSKTAGSPVLIGGMQDNGTDMLSSAGINWTGVIGGDGGYAATTENDWLWYASSQNGKTYRITFDSNFKITSFGRVDPEELVKASGTSLLFINPFILDPNNQNKMFYAGGTRLYFNANVAQIPGGTQNSTTLGWEHVTTNEINSGIISAFGFSTDSEQLYFGTTTGQLFRLDNANDQLNFSVVDISNSMLPESGYVSSIAVDPENKDHFLVIFSNYNIPSIFESNDGGSSFEDVSGSLEENRDGTGSGPSIRWGEIIPTLTGSLYVVGTSTGLYMTTSLSENSIWTKQGIEEIGSSVIPMLDYRLSDGKLAIATHGNGIFTTQIPDFKAIDSDQSDRQGFKVFSAYPNPFNDKITIPFEIPEDGEVRINIHSIKGDLITTILWAPQYAGYNEVTWTGTNAAGTTLFNGIYLYTIEYNGQVRSGRVLLRR
ncbi:MAG: T9SS type A sorting domain-containing protein [Ekhidna sp.]|nr:T9SS type A sorting domain-containing protein [Ekhidna sp.]